MLPIPFAPEQPTIIGKSFYSPLRERTGINEVPPLSQMDKGLIAAKLRVVRGTKRTQSQ